MNQAQQKLTSKKVFCRTCKTATNHQILSDHHNREDDDEHGITYWTDSYLLQCKGCEAICFVVDNTCTEDFDPEKNTLIPTTRIYPNPYVRRNKVDGFYFLPKAIQQVYEECVSGFNKNLSIITTIGLRLIIELLCKDKGINNGNLEDKINRMAILGIITEEQKNILHVIRHVGNGTAHDSLILDDHKLGLVFDVVENALSNVYIIPKKAEQLREFYSSLDVTVEKDVAS